MTELTLTTSEWLALQRAAILIIPCLVAGVLLIVEKPAPRAAVAALVAFLWQLPALLLLHVLATHSGWWAFAGDRNMLLGLPIDIWIGWAIWWGPVAIFLNRWLSAPVLIAASVLIDVVSMPLLTPLVSVGPHWLIGDAVAMALCLAPALWMAKLTREDRLPKRRAMFHVLGWGGFMVMVIPICALSYNGEPLSELYRVPVSLADFAIVSAGLLLLFVGVSATAEFARVGLGTPIPFDPPKRVVSSGPYAFTANPMQIISAFFMAVLALYAGSWALAFVALMFAIFDSVYATWFNRVNIANAMPQSWSSYRDAVDEWRMRWRPHVAGKAEIVISPDGPSRAVWDAVWPKLSQKLEGQFLIVTSDRARFKRLIYRRDGFEDIGIRALARIFEHGPVPLAMIGWVLRFPYLGGALQRLSMLMIQAWRWQSVPRRSDEV